MITHAKATLQSGCPVNQNYVCTLSTTRCMKNDVPTSIQLGMVYIDVIVTFRKSHEPKGHFSS